MLTFYNYEGKNRDEIEAKALLELNVSKDNIITNTKQIEEGKLFKSKKVSMTIIKKEDIINYVKEYISELSQKFNIEINSEVRFNEDILKIVLVSNNNSILIGKEGRTLNAIQTLLRSSISNQSHINIKINIDASNYKANREKNLEYEINKIAKDVLTSHIEVKLDPMNSYDRRCVHNTIAKYDNLQSLSYGEAPNRYIVISYKED